jgi:thiamine biosynthesis protein ThiS
MKITINGQPYLIELNQHQSSANLEQLIEQLAQEKQPEFTFRNAIDALSSNFVLALNSDFVPRSLYSSTRIHHGDELEILSPMVGG